MPPRLGKAWHGQPAAEPAAGFRLRGGRGRWQRRACPQDPGRGAAAWRRLPCGQSVLTAWGRAWACWWGSLPASFRSGLSPLHPGHVAAQAPQLQPPHCGEFGGQTVFLGGRRGPLSGGEGEAGPGGQGSPAPHPHGPTPFLFPVGASERNCWGKMRCRPDVTEGRGGFLSGAHAGGDGGEGSVLGSRIEWGAHLVPREQPRPDLWVLGAVHPTGAVPAGPHQDRSSEGGGPAVSGVERPCALHVRGAAFQCSGLPEHEGRTLRQAVPVCVPLTCIPRGLLFCF